MFSLEDEEINDLFITQESKSDKIKNNSIICPDAFDFKAPLVSLILPTTPHYSDISDDEALKFHVHK